MTKVGELDLSGLGPEFKQPPTKELRDEFAMAALTGLLAKGLASVAVAKEAYAIADQMIAQRGK